MSTPTAEKPVIYLRFDTSSFTFDAVGHCQQQLITLLLAAWREHAEQTGADLHYAKACVEDGGVSIREMQCNVIYRDDEPMMEAIPHG